MGRTLNWLGGAETTKLAQSIKWSTPPKDNFRPFNILFFYRIAGTRISSNQIVGATDVTVELHISSAMHSDSGTFQCKAEPKYFQHQTIKTFVLKESSINLNVVRKHIKTRSSAFITMPLSIFLIVLISCSFMIL